MHLQLNNMSTCCTRTLHTCTCMQLEYIHRTCTLLEYIYFYMYTIGVHTCTCTLLEYIYVHVNY